MLHPADKKWSRVQARTDRWLAYEIEDKEVMCHNQVVKDPLGSGYSWLFDDYYDEDEDDQGIWEWSTITDNLFEETI